MYIYTYIYIYIYVPGSRFGSPPSPRWYGTPLPPNKSTICIISESGPPICMLFAAFQSNNLPLATYLQDLRAVYFLQNILVLTMYYLHATYVLAIYIYVYFFSTYLRPIGYLCNYSYVILLFVLYYILLIACVYATHTHTHIYIYITHSAYTLPLSYSSTTDKLHQPPQSPPPPTPQGEGATTYTA